MDQVLLMRASDWIEAQKGAASAQNGESDLIDVFVAMGGNPDKSGHVEAERLRRSIKAFELR
jgi:hypothetical protein